MVSHDVTWLFTCIPTQEVVQMMTNGLVQDETLLTGTNFTPDHICVLLDLCLMTTYFQSSEGYYRQKHSWALDSPVFTWASNLYMEEVESRAPMTFTGPAPRHCFRHVDHTWVNIRTRGVEAFTEHINAVDSNIELTVEDVRGDCLPLLDWAVHTGEDGRLNIEVYREPSHGSTRVVRLSSPTSWVIRTLNHWAEAVPTKWKGKETETCGYPNWTFVRTSKWSRADNKEEETRKHNNIFIPSVAGTSEKLSRIFNKHHILVHFKPSNTLRQKLVHHKDKTQT